MDVYRTVPSGRLVVLGRAGSGKTILTGRFVLDFLKARTDTDAVPVVFSLGSWNPTTTPLRDWLTSQLNRDHPGLAATGPDGMTLGAALVQTDRILPVLDGFDEIADGLRRAALTALNATRLPLLLTSRTTEYATAVAATDVLSAAAVIELTDLTLTDLADYLPRTIRKTTDGTDTTTTMWDPVLTELREHPERRASVNLAAVLTTPLMVALARTIYSDTPDHNPATLLNTDRFDSPETLEDHLVGNFIPTVYQQQPGNRPASEHRRWDPDRVHYWLGYLATHLDHLGTRDLGLVAAGPDPAPLLAHHRNRPRHGNGLRTIHGHPVLHSEIEWEWVTSSAVMADHGSGLMHLAPQGTADRGRDAHSTQQCGRGQQPTDRRGRQRQDNRPQPIA